MGRTHKLAPAIFKAKGPVAEFMRAFDWQRTSLGRPEAWPQSLRSALSICLNARNPACLYWGPELTLLYNDAWGALVEDKHPWALGRPGREVWPEIWDLMRARFTKASNTGAAVWQEDELTPVRRSGYIEECYFDHTITPVWGEGNEAAGFFSAAIETSGRVISERRIRLLQRLREGTAGAQSAQEVYGLAAKILTDGAEDVPFCLIYKLGTPMGARHAKLAAVSGIAAGTPASPGIVALDGRGASAASWPLHSVLLSGTLEIVEDLGRRFGMTFTGGAWPEGARSAAVVPIPPAPAMEAPAGFLILGLNPRQPFNEDYRAFVRLAVSALGEAALRASAADESRQQAAEQQAIVEFALNRVHEAAFLVDKDSRFLYVNDEATRSLGYSREELLSMCVADIDPDFPAESWSDYWNQAARETSRTFETRHKTKDGRILPVEINCNYFEYGGRTYNIGLARGIAERKRQEQERIRHLRFFESMDRISRAMQGTNDLGEMLDHVLGEVLDIFDCDRAWLLYPADPDAPSWRVPMERSRPGYENSEPTKLDMTMDAFMAEMLREMRAAPGPVKYLGTDEHKLGDKAARFQIKSQISMAIYPKTGKPWLFGLHQCSRERIWTEEEEKLFEVIGRRLPDGLTSLLTFRDLQKSEEKYREVFDNVSDALALLDITDDGRFRLADLNPVAENIFGISKAKAHGQAFEDVFSPDLAECFLPLLRQSAGTGCQLSREHSVSLLSRSRFLRTSLLPVRNCAGSVYRLIALCSDITERKTAEQHMDFLMNEVNHRAKNLLAVVQAVVRLSASNGNPLLFAGRLEERIASLAASHDLLVKNEWKGVDVGKLVTSQLSHFKDLIETRVLLKGPSALLKPPAAQALGMALHELATNAGKYGALSCAKGSVHVEWDVSANTGRSRFRIRWSEHNGPPVKKPQHQGFGQKVMVQMAQYALNAEVALSYPSTGVIWELTAPAVHAVETNSIM
jgi:PAS domain S-box-containing protein